ncbi:hypothetical protein HK101_010656 [Irineochytrium annulatum]|nr:hypothetical protein HK101_010656 [Irineochytrium annulatum]
MPSPLTSSSSKTAPVTARLVHLVLAVICLSAVIVTFTDVSISAAGLTAPHHQIPLTDTPRRYGGIDRFLANLKSPDGAYKTTPLSVRLPDADPFLQYEWTRNARRRRNPDEILQCIAGTVDDRPGDTSGEPHLVFFGDSVSRKQYNVLMRRLSQPEVNSSIPHTRQQQSVLVPHRGGNVRFTFDFQTNLSLSIQRFDACCANATALVVNNGMWEMFDDTTRLIEDFAVRLARFGLHASDALLKRSHTERKPVMLWRDTNRVRHSRIGTRGRNLTNVRIRTLNDIAGRILTPLGFGILRVNEMLFGDVEVDGDWDVVMDKDGFHPSERSVELMLDATLDQVCGEDGVDGWDREATLSMASTGPPPTARFVAHLVLAVVCLAAVNLTFTAVSITAVGLTSPHHPTPVPGSPQQHAGIDNLLASFRSSDGTYKTTPTTIRLPDADPFLQYEWTRNARRRPTPDEILQCVAGTVDDSAKAEPHLVFFGDSVSRRQFNLLMRLLSLPEVKASIPHMQQQQSILVPHNNGHVRFTFDFQTNMSVATQRFESCCSNATALVVNAGLWEMFDNTTRLIEDFAVRLARFGLRASHALLHRHRNSRRTKAPVLLWRDTTRVRHSRIGTRGRHLTNVRIRALNDLAARILTPLGFEIMAVNEILFGDMEVEGDWDIVMDRDGFHPSERGIELMLDMTLDRICGADPNLGDTLGSSGNRPYVAHAASIKSLLTRARHRDNSSSTPAMQPERRPHTLAEARAILTSDDWFPMSEATIRGVRQRVWKNAPHDLREVLVTSARVNAANDFIVFEDQRMTHGKHFARVVALANALHVYGIRKGDRVAILMQNCPEWIISFWSIVVLGAIAVPVNAWLKPTESLYCLENSGARFMFTDAERLVALAPVLADLRGVERIVVCGGDDGRRSGDASRVVTLEEFDVVGRSKTGLPEVEIGEDDDCTIFYTSGTTGRPKGAVGTHRNFLTNLVSGAVPPPRNALRSGIDIPPSIRSRTLAAVANPANSAKGRPSFLLGIPLFHVMGCHVVMATSLASGGKVTIMRKWDAKRALELIEREKISAVGGVPTLVWQIIEHPDRKLHDLSSIRSFFFGGAPSPKELSTTIKKNVPKKGSRTASNGYGMTETSSSISQNSGVDYDLRPDSVGIPPYVMDVRIVRPGTFINVPKIGDVGEIAVKGPNVVRGYWNNPEATKKCFSDDGWFLTGDVGRVDEEGFIYILDRAKDMLIRGGENIYCVEVEDCIYSHPAVMDCAVVGLPHRTLGEEVAAGVTIKPDYVGKIVPEDIIRHCQAKIARFKCPVFVVLYNEPLERNATGKVVKTNLKAEIISKYKSATNAKL